VPEVHDDPVKHLHPRHLDVPSTPGGCISSGNGLFLWVFGNNVEDSMGRLRFIVFYHAVRPVRGRPPQGPP
jgi:hypothetical protein